MLRLTPYLWVIVVLVIAFGPWMPVLGFVVPIVFLGAFISGIRGGRWMCGNLCPRGSFNDNVLARFGRNTSIPPVLSDMRVRYGVLLALMGFMAYRLSLTSGIVNQVGMVFVSMCIVTTAAAVVLGLGINPRTWCVFCPMGTVQRLLGRGRIQREVNPALCIDCGGCDTSCPMQLKVRGEDALDCLACGRCAKTCPKRALKVQVP